MENNNHPVESQSELGQGISITHDWRDNWSNYEGMDKETGFAHCELDEIEGEVPGDLVGTLYRNGPGKLELNGERVQHTLDGDALVYKIQFPSPNSSDGSQKNMFTSRFVHTRAFQEERKAGRFLYRGTFGTGPLQPWLRGRHSSKVEDPETPGFWSKLVSRAFKVDIKNAANTQVVSFGGKLLALFEAGLPHRLDPETLETLGEDTIGGILREGLPVKVEGLPSVSFAGGSAHTAHPQVCPGTGNLVGWHWTSLVPLNDLEITFTEYVSGTFEPQASSTFRVTGCQLAPHDMAITDDYIIMNINCMSMNQLPFLFGVKGPAEALSMDGRAPVQTWVFPRPTSSLAEGNSFGTSTPACFTIHHSLAYKCEKTGHLVTYFSGWPPSDSKDFMGAWGGFAPDFKKILPTFLWRLEVDPVWQRTVDLATGIVFDKVGIEHILVNPRYISRPARHVYGAVSIVVGDSTAPNGYARLDVEERSTDAYWFGSRYFTTEPLIVPQDDGDERSAYLLGVVRDAAARRNFLAIFDLRKDLISGPIAKIWFQHGAPHGVHGCFTDGTSLFFC